MSSNQVDVVTEKPSAISEKLRIVAFEDTQYIFCPIRKKAYSVDRKPEEIVRQKMLYKLRDEYGYSWDQISVEVPVQVGSTEAKKAADIVVYSDVKKKTPRVFIEVKKPKRTDGLEQLKVYMNATGCRLGMWANGTDPNVYLLRVEPSEDREEVEWRELRNIPRKNEKLSDVDSPLTRKELVPVGDLLSVVKDCENYIKSHQGVDAFDEIFKIIFAKLFDERRNLKNDSSPAQFRVNALEEPSEARARIVELFQRAKQHWSGVFKPGEQILLDDHALAFCVSAFQRLYLLKSDVDVLGAAFEVMVNPTMKGDKGQYFTPRHLIDLCVNVLDPGEFETVLDPACGSGGFLVGALDHVFRKIESERDDASEILENKKDYASENVFGIDYDGLVAKVAKAYMLIWGDGRSNINVDDGLELSKWNSNTKSSMMVENDAGEQVPREFDVVMMNPPFAGKISSASTLKNFELARKSSKNGKVTMQRSVSRDVLFVERGLEFLKPGGRMAIVVPRGMLKNYGAEVVRRHILKRAKVRAVVGLNGNMFQPFTNTKTCVLFLQKRNKMIIDLDEIHDDPDILFAVSQRVGKDSGGKFIRDLTGEISSDLPEIRDYLIENLDWETM